MSKKRFVLLLLVVFSVVSVFAGGKRQIDEKFVENKESWKESFDINDKKPGKYNIIVTAEDQGGNVTINGPHNIFIDPESDLPISGITNPRANMRVPGNLNIVGTCTDDDAVERVEIVLDGDTENPLLATGKDFWSYYLDTTKMTEGAHVIAVYGIDINGKIGHSQIVTWHLDRRQPLTTVTSHEMGALVSEKIKLQGTVADGNGIESLSYSLDGGQNYKEVSLKTKNDDIVSYFTLPIDTKKLPDGGTVCWFKSVDKQGTQGLYSFLFFVDNTKPDVKIVYPTPTQAINGKFTVAGYAKDIIGVQSLSWAFAGQTGDFELIAGNPYWSLDLDVRNSLAKTQELTITAKDTVGNVTAIKQKLLIDSLADLPVVNISSPVEGNVLYDDLTLRGIATDDDGVASVSYSVDGAEPTVILNEGAFSENITSRLGLTLATGPHSIKVWATDIHEVQGNAVTINFIAPGEKPTFDEVRLFKGKKANQEEAVYESGTEVNPEYGAELKLAVSSTCGIDSVIYQFSGMEEKTIPLNAAKGTSSVVIPVKDCKWGFTEIKVKAKDIYGRISDKSLFLYITNLTKTRGEPQVVFSDNTVAQDGVILLDAPQIVTGFFMGGKAESVKFEPATNFASVKLEGNVIRIIPKKQIGVSDPVSVVVTTDKGVVYRSRTLKLRSEVPVPTLTLDTAGIQDGYSTVTIKGKTVAASDLSISQVSYRVLHTTENGSWQRVKFDAKTGNFTISCPETTFIEGVSVIEVRSVDTLNQDVTQCVFVRKMPPVPTATEPGKKAPPTPAPVLSWIEGKEVYYTGAYSDVLNLTAVTLVGQTLSEYTSAIAGVIPKSKLVAGPNNLELSVTDVNGKAYKAAFVAKKTGKVNVFLKSINDVPYTSGMEVVVPCLDSTDPAPTLAIGITSDLLVNAVRYSIDGGDQIAASAVSMVGSDSYEATISLKGFPAEQTRISVYAETSDGNFVTSSGTITIVRSRDPELIDDKEQIYWPETRRNEQGYAVLKTSDQLEAYANLKTPITAKLAKSIDGVLVEVDEKRIILSPSKVGAYDDVIIVATDAEGITYKSTPMSFIVDMDKPLIEISSPKNQQWVQNSVTLSGTITDSVGILSAEYSIDNGTTWIPLDTKKSGAITYSTDIDLTSLEDGIVPIYVRVNDRSGKTSVKQTVIFKDTQAPEVTVLVPAPEDVVNGETRIVFNVKDNGKTEKAEYVAKNNVALPNSSYISVMTGTKDCPIAQDMKYKFTDKSGNSTEMAEWAFVVDAESDLPVAEIHVPSDNEIIQNDFVISGVVIDDDGESKIFYKIDNGSYIALDGYGSSYSIPVPLTSMTDNEHTVTVYAEDIHGVRSKEVVRPFRISLEEPKGAVELPKIETTVNGSVIVSGWASDKNGISKVQISVDNGVTFNEVAGTEKWSYEFDTRIIKDGTHAVFIKVWDGYEVQGIYSSLINIDNTAPEINLELPLDGSKTTKMLFFSGQTTDNIGLKSLKAKISNLELKQKAVPPSLAEMSFVPEEIITKSFDLSGLADGFYNIELIGEDAGGNVTRVSRNIELNKAGDAAKIDLLSPLNGEYLHGMFNLYGSVVSEEKFETLVLYIDGQESSVTELSPTGYFKFTLSPTELSSGSHTLQVRGLLNGSKVINSNEIFVIYQPGGPWVTIDNLTLGDFAVDRPYLEGSAGYALTESELLSLRDKATPKDIKEELAQKSVSRLEISFDNGKTFMSLGSTKKWRYRIENEDMPEGYHFLIVRAIMKNGETVATRSIVQIDKNAPSIKLIAPVPSGRFNETLEFAGLTSDDVNLKDVKIALRPGDKSSYELPSFIQGLYFDWHFLGATLYDVGLGLTFFDDNVKLQGQFGQMTQSQFDLLRGWGGYESAPFRYGGDVWGIKLLANVAYIPFRYFLGPNWEWLSANFTIGANFSMFSESQSGKAQVLSAVLGQVEFPRITIPKQKMFRTFSVYTEFQVWFIPTDVDSGSVEVQSLVPQVSAGVRVNVF